MEGSGGNDCATLLQAAGVKPETVRAMCAGGRLAALTVTAQRGDPFAFMNQMMARADATMNRLMASGYFTGGDIEGCVSSPRNCLHAFETRQATTEWLDRQKFATAGQLNKARHLYGACYLTQRWGSDVARSVTAAHERYWLPRNRNSFRNHNPTAGTISGTTRSELPWGYRVRIVLPRGQGHSQ